MDTKCPDRGHTMNFMTLLKAKQQIEKENWPAPKYIAIEAISCRCGQIWMGRIEGAKDWTELGPIIPCCCEGSEFPDPDTCACSPECVRCK